MFGHIMLMKPVSGDVVPTGIILPLYAAGSVPTGFSLWTSANGKHILGAGSSYSAGANGSGTGAVARPSTSAGGHVGVTLGREEISGGYGGNTSGAHTHTVTFTYVPPYQQIRLIKSTQDLASLPINVMVLGAGSITDMSNVYTNGYMFKGNTSAGTGGSNSQSGLGTSTAGSHYHAGAYNRSGSPIFGNTSISDGGHNHGAINITLTNYIGQVALSAWVNASAKIAVSTGMIGMWESATPPEGWAICNGGSGTPDLRDYFVKLVGSGSEAAGTGNGTVTVTAGAVGSLGNHRHYHTSLSLYTTAIGKHLDYVNMAGHSWNNNYGWLPPYYALYFIQKIAV